MVKIISKITIDCVEHEDVVYYRWKENDWRVTGMEDDIVPINEDWQWLEDLFQEAKRKERLKCLDGLDVMSELNGCKRMSDIKTKLKVYDTNNRIDYELYEDYTRFKSLNLTITKAIGSNTLIVDLPCKDSGWQTWRYLYTTPHNLYGLRGLFFDQVDIDDCTTLSRDLEDWILTRMTRHES